MKFAPAAMRGMVLLNSSFSYKLYSAVLLFAQLRMLNRLLLPPLDGLAWSSDIMHAVNILQPCQCRWLDENEEEIASQQVPRFSSICISILLTVGQRRMGQSAYSVNVACVCL